MWSSYLQDGEAGAGGGVAESVQAGRPWPLAQNRGAHPPSGAHVHSMLSPHTHAEGVPRGPVCHLRVPRKEQLPRLLNACLWDQLQTACSEKRAGRATDLC